MKTYTLDEILAMKPTLEDDRQTYVNKDGKHYIVKINVEGYFILKEAHNETM